jgi:hypothetical protein
MGDAVTETRRIWYNRPKGKETAAAITAEATLIEEQSIPRRWRSYTFWRTMTGRPVNSQLAFSMSRRPSNFQSWYGGYQFNPVRAGLSGTLGDIYVNRVFVHRTFLSMVPERGDFSQRQTGLQMEDWIEGMFETLRFWDEFKQCCIDALYYGTGFLKFYSEDEGEKKPCLKVRAVNPDELLWSNEDLPLAHQTSVIQRVWTSKEELLAKYKDDPEAVKAISKAESFPCFFFGPGQLQTADVVPLLEGWRVKRKDGKPGRHVLAIAEACLLDEKFDDERLPFETFQFHEIPSCIYGQGLAELTLQFSEWVDELWNTHYDADARSGKGKWLKEENSAVNEQALGDTQAAVVTYAGVKPEYVAYEPLGQWANQRMEMLYTKAAERVHVSFGAINGETPKALNSAVALERWAQIDDSNYAEMIGRLEDLVKRSGYQLINLAKKVKPSFTRMGRTKELIDWSKLRITDGTPVDLTAFNTGRLGQTIAGKVQQLKDMLADGDIDRRLFNKVPAKPRHGPAPG